MIILKNTSQTIDEKILENIEIQSNSKYFYLNSSQNLMTLNEGTLSNGIDIVKKIIVLSKSYYNEENSFMKSIESFKNDKNIENSYIAQKIPYKIDYFIEESKNIFIINFTNKDLDFLKVNENLEIINNKEIFNKKRNEGNIDLSQIIIINENLTIKELIKLYKIAIQTKLKYFEDLKLPKHIQTILNKDEFLTIACNVSNNSDIDKITDINQLINLKNKNIVENKENHDGTDKNKRFEKIKKELIEIIIKSSDSFLNKLNLSFGILDYILAEGITIDSLVDAGMELCVGVEKTQEIREKLKNQILKSLEDLNVIALLMSAIRCEEDFQNNRLKEVDVSDDPAYLYTDEVLGIAIANQIAGTKATFNFKRYDEVKPGIIAKLGPMVDDIFAGLVAGCMSKIFEE